MEGKFKQSQFHGKGYRVDITYGQVNKILFGEFAHGLPHKMNTLRPDRGSIEHGKFIHGNKVGASLEIRPFSSYFGQWEDDKTHGLGVEKENGSKPSYYCGLFSRGNKKGIGKLISYDGSIYIGHFFAGQKLGCGQITYKDGSSYTGFFA
mmetsp:Transcript_58847/g.80877  ORF Transcript_58847/g.80877 Transcript_58847/m.80877 type:complete len:150 (-) Transcript_58847:34-483(-)